MLLNLLVILLALSTQSAGENIANDGDLCYSKYLKRYFRVGQKWREEGCTRAECVPSRVTGRPSAYVVGCRFINENAVTPGCRVAILQPDSEWPQCCPRTVCDANGVFRGTTTPTTRPSPTTARPRISAAPEHQRVGSSDLQSISELLLHVAARHRPCRGDHCQLLSGSPIAGSSTAAGSGVGDSSGFNQQDQDRRVTSLLHEVTSLGGCRHGGCSLHDVERLASRFPCPEGECLGKILETIARDAAGCEGAGCSSVQQPPPICQGRQCDDLADRLMNEPCEGDECIPNLLLRLLTDEENHEEGNFISEVTRKRDNVVSTSTSRTFTESTTEERILASSTFSPTTEEPTTSQSLHFSSSTFSFTTPKPPSTFKPFFRLRGTGATTTVPSTTDAITTLPRTTTFTPASTTLKSNTTQRAVKKSSSNQLLSLQTSADPCALKNGGCSHKCEALPNGRSRCICPNAIQLNSDGLTCGNSSTSSGDPLLLFSSRDTLFLMRLDGSGLETVATQLTNAVGLDYDVRRRCIYWTVVRNISTVNRKCDYKEPEVLYSGPGGPDNIAVDWVTGNVYWTDGPSSSIQVVDQHGRFHRSVISEGLSRPRAICHLPELGRMYYTDWGERPFIGTAGMDGSDPRVIVTGDLTWPNALTISRETRQLFWADAKLGRVEVSDLAGRKRRVLLQSPSGSQIRPLKHIFSLVVFGKQLFWSSWETNGIIRYNGTHALTLRKTPGLPMSLKVLHSSVQEPLKKGDPCYGGANNCAQLCLLSPGGATAPARCACADGHVTTDGGLTCRVAEPVCGRHQFLCRPDNRCLSLHTLCDAKRDCSDGSDEPKTCPPFNCRQGEFQCRTGQCLTKSQLCDDKSDCLDGVDELHCSS